LCESPIAHLLGALPPNPRACSGPSNSTQRCSYEIFNINFHVSINTCECGYWHCRINHALVGGRSWGQSPQTPAPAAGLRPHRVDARIKYSIFNISMTPKTRYSVINWILTFKTYSYGVSLEELNGGKYSAAQSCGRPSIHI
jgi:hypothetical protein